MSETSSCKNGAVAFAKVQRKMEIMKEKAEKNIQTLFFEYETIIYIVKKKLKLKRVISKSDISFNFA